MAWFKEQRGHEWMVRKDTKGTTTVGTKISEIFCNILYQVVAVMCSFAVYRQPTRRDRKKKKKNFLFPGLRYDPHLDC